jgi:hypothetical protein
MKCTVQYVVVDNNARILEIGRELQKSDAVLAYAIDEQSDTMIWSEIDYQLSLWMEYNDSVRPYYLYTDSYTVAAGTTCA